MSPDANAGSLILNMLAFVGTVVLLSLFAYDLIRGRKIAKAKERMTRRWSRYNRPPEAEPAAEDFAPEADGSWAAQAESKNW